MLTADERARIEGAVRAAENTTSAEFACVVSDEASDYSEVPLLWAASIVMLVPLAPLTILAFILQVREAFMGWIVGPEVSPAAPAGAVAFYAMAQCIAFIALLLILSVPSLRRLVTPRALKRRFVRERALEHFISKGLGDISEHNGLLLFVSVKDKCAEIVAGREITSRIPSTVWSDASRALTAEVRKGRIADGLTAALASCARTLAQAFPRLDNDQNEIPDAVADLAGVTTGAA